MRDFYFFLILLLLFRFSASAQVANSGVHLKIIDSLNSLPITTAEVVLNHLGQNGQISGYVDQNGLFDVQLVSGERYRLQISAVGYNKLDEILSASDFKENILVYVLSKDPETLREVAIKSVGPAVLPTIEGLNYNVESDSENETLSVLDVLKKVPLVSVDGNERVLLKGSSDFKFYVNGLPSTLLSTDATNVLKTMLGASIKRIEVITQPSSRYDAEGVSSIINIVTRKNFIEGYNGAVQLGYVSKLGATTSGTITVSSGKLILSENIGYSGQYQPRFQNGNYQHSFVENTVINQNGYRDKDSYFWYSSTEASYQIDSLNLLNASFVIYNSPAKLKSFFSNQIVDLSESMTRNYDQFAREQEKYGNSELALNYQWKFKKNEEATLTVSYQHLNIHEEIDKWRKGEIALEEEGSELSQENRLKVNEHSAQLDFVYPLDTWKVEGGLKAILRKNSSRFQDAQLGTSNPLEEERFLDHHQNVFSFYNSYDFNFLNGRLKAGARMEITRLGLRELNSSELKSNYANLIPSIIFQKELTPSKNFKLSYNQRIQRPSVWQLNPFTDQSNSLFIYSGNKNLRRVLLNSLAVDYQSFNTNTFVLGIFYDFTGNGIEDVTSLIGDSLLITKPENVGKRRETGSTLAYSLNLNKWSFNLNGKLSYIYLKSNQGDLLYKNKGFQGSLTFYGNYRIADGFSTSFFSGYQSRNLHLQGIYSGYYYVSFGVRKGLLNNKATVSFNLSEPFSKYRTYKNTIRGQTFYKTSYSDSYVRRFNLSFSYRFGNSQASVARSEKVIINSDVKNK